MQFVLIFIVTISSVSFSVEKKKGCCNCPLTRLFWAILLSALLLINMRQYVFLFLLIVGRVYFQIVEYNFNGLVTITSFCRMKMPSLLIMQRLTWSSLNSGKLEFLFFRLYNKFPQLMEALWLIIQYGFLILQICWCLSVISNDFGSCDQIIFLLICRHCQAYGSMVELLASFLFGFYCFVMFLENFSETLMWSSSPWK